MAWLRTMNWAVGPWVLALNISACTDPIELETDGAESGSVPTGGSTSADGGTSADSTDSGSPLPTERQVDILFVVDNSGSMGEEQGLMVASIDVLLDALEGADPPVDYRIGMTTSDNGNPCVRGQRPRGAACGRPRASPGPRSSSFPGR